jgi:hypothetical protein
MELYAAGDVFSTARTGCVYVERNTPQNVGRRGLVIAVDLERYDWKDSAPRLIRCTEGTVAERIPPRMDIRRGAALETSHVLLLIDDEQDKLLPELARRAKTRDPAYRSRLMPESGGACFAGDISGWFLDSVDDWAFIASRLEELASRALTRYCGGGKIADDGGSGAEPFLFAAGDGNHSLATAKEIWEEYKKNHSAAGKPDCASEGGCRPEDGSSFAGGLPIHPCRYALVEIENLYDPAIQFEPIQRIVFGIQREEALALLSQLPGFSSRRVSRSELPRLVQERADNNRLGLIASSGAAGGPEMRYALIETNAPGLATASLQALLDSWLARNVGSHASIDYIHGDDELFRLAETRPDGIPAAGILLPPIKKSGLFETVAASGPLPRKSFSMGAAQEKRFYLECRSLFGG